MSMPPPRPDMAVLRSLVDNIARAFVARGYENKPQHATLDDDEDHDIKIAFATHVPDIRPALIIADGKVFCSLTHDSAFHWISWLYNIWPTFRIRVRENQFVSDQKQRRSDSAIFYKGARAPVPSVTVNGLDPKDFANDYYEEEWLFDLDVLSNVTMEYMIASGRDELREVLANESGPPMRLPQTSARSHSPRTNGKQTDERDFWMFAIAPKTAECQRAVATVVILPGRALALDGVSRNDWFLTRYEDYHASAHSPFEDYMEDTELELPIPVKLRGDIAVPSSKVIHSPNFRSSYSLVDFPDAHDRSVSFEGELMELAPHGMAFVIEAAMPLGPQDKPDFVLNDGDEYLVHIV
ncbi:hypothetical protein LTR56_012700 [Elasticomyces elasticus]|nr:hypothetical protein LTR22_022666 [Elasticomyces elasticus]KAK3638977.1 hypothetical protein LTR56_012700 [Elasticomyces elasticus]KAK4918769.1 hypothetical protein LTR49_013556 [Elasticomyces elasticus]KAK5754402.1 hypothetical protein LTS12_015471 [Elasticomyces elasticus]